MRDDYLIATLRFRIRPLTDIRTTCATPALTAKLTKE